MSRGRDYNDNDERNQSEGQRNKICGGQPCVGEDRSANLVMDRECPGFVLPLRPEVARAEDVPQVSCGWISASLEVLILVCPLYNMDVVDRTDGLRSRGSVSLAVGFSLSLNSLCSITPPHTQHDDDTSNTSPHEYFAKIK